MQSFYEVLPGGQERTVLYGVVQLADRQLLVATMHMESPLDAGAIRAAQLSTIFKQVGSLPEVIVLGDFNFGDGREPESASLDPTFVDLWRDLRPGDPSFTWNMEQSPLARKNSFFGESSGRIDRILMRSATWAPHDIRILGDGPIDPARPDLYPSDHFGLLGILTRQVAQGEGERTR
jgi:endonuclease/exonuclease/phosphatase family metal-dependent hydrolase